MAKSKLAALGASLAVLTGILAFVTSGQRRAVLPMNVIPDSGIVLAWHFRTADCLGCAMPDYTVRKLEQELGGQLQFIAIHIERVSDEGIPRGFFRKRRLNPDVLQTVDSNAHTEIYGELTLPVISLLRDGRAIWTNRQPVDAKARAADVPLDEWLLGLLEVASRSVPE